MLTGCKNISDARILLKKKNTKDKNTYYTLRNI